MNNKRKTLKRIAGVGAVASAIPNAWFKPIVNSVMLPAHAQTSGAVGYSLIRNPSSKTKITQNTRTNSLIDFFISPAIACDTYTGLGGSVTAELKAPGIYTVRFQPLDGEYQDYIKGRWTGEIMDNGTVGTLTLSHKCQGYDFTNSFPASIKSVSENALVLEIIDTYSNCSVAEDFYSFTLSPGLSPLPELCVDS